MAKLDLASDRFNYLVNGSFESRQWEWDIKGDKDLKYSFSGERNCDSATNFIAQCHLNQGLSLKLDIPAKSAVTITSCRPIETDTAAALNASMFVFGKDNLFGSKQITVAADFNGVKTQTRHLNAGLNEDWQEFRFSPLAVKPGKYIFKATLTNNTDSVQTLFMDNLQVMIKPGKAK